MTCNTFIPSFEEGCIKDPGPGIHVEADICSSAGPEEREQDSEAQSSNECSRIKYIIIPAQSLSVSQSFQSFPLYLLFLVICCHVASPRPRRQINV